MPRTGHCGGHRAQTTRMAVRSSIRTLFPALVRVRRIGPMRWSRRAPRSCSAAHRTEAVCSSRLYRRSLASVPAIARYRARARDLLVAVYSLGCVGVRL